MNPYNRQQMGDEAEAQAAHFLISKGLQLITTKYRCYHGEIDIILRDQEDIVFVEVRKRQYTNYGSAIESVNRQKIQKLIKAAKHFLQQQKWLYKVTSRFDVIGIHPISGEMQLEWIKNAFTVDNDW
jgi:putative endonuclease